MSELNSHPPGCGGAASVATAWTAPVLMVAILATGAIAGCTSQTEMREAELDQLLHWLPGRYDNSAQAKSDALHNVRPPHDALALVVVPVDDPLIGKFVYYVQEMAADDPRRVMAQRVWTFEVTDKGIVQSVWTLAEPLRWREGERDPDLLRSLMKQDVVQTRGCDLNWKKTDGHFSASNDPKHCQQTSRITSGTIHIETRLQLQAAELGLAENATDAAGQLVQGRTDEPFYRFQKVAP